MRPLLVLRAACVGERGGDVVAPLARVVSTALLAGFLRAAGRRLASVAGRKRRRAPAFSQGLSLSPVVVGVTWAPGLPDIDMLREFADQCASTSRRLLVLRSARDCLLGRYGTGSRARAEACLPPCHSRCSVSGGGAISAVITYLPSLLCSGSQSCGPTARARCGGFYQAWEAWGLAFINT